MKPKRKKWNTNDQVHCQNSSNIWLTVILKVLIIFRSLQALKKGL